MKFQFLLAGILASLFALAPVGACHGGFGCGGVMAVVQEVFKLVVWVFTVADGFMAGEAFMTGAYAVGVSGTFTAIAVFLTMIVFSFPVSVFMDTRGGGIGVIRIPIILIILTPTIRIRRIFQTTTSISGLWIHF
jgi:hypothetical protein